MKNIQCIINPPLNILKIKVHLEFSRLLKDLFSYFSPIRVSMLLRFLVDPLTKKYELFVRLLLLRILDDSAYPCLMMALGVVDLPNPWFFIFTLRLF